MASKIGRSSCGMPDQNGHRDPATPEEICNILREVAESQKETDRRMQETDLRLRKLGELFNGQWGKLMESLVEGDLVRLLNQRRIAVDHTITNAKKNYGERRWEFDILAVNGEEGRRRRLLRATVAGFCGADAGIRRPAHLRGGGLPQDRWIRDRPCRAAGTVRNPGHRQ